MSIDNGVRPHFGADEHEGLSVAIPARRWVAPLGVLASVLLGVVVFWALNESRTHPEARQGAPAAQTALDSLPEPTPAQAMTMAQATEAAQAAAMPVTDAVLPPPPLAAQASDADARLKSPALVVDLSDASLQQQSGATKTGQSLQPGAISSALSPQNALNADESFAERLGVGGGDNAARARRLNNQGYMIVQGSFLPAVLETAVNSDLPGYVRAVVSRDVKSFDGARVLVPRGARLIGQYRSGVALGASRAFVIWTRLIRPDGVNVDLAAPGTDTLGRGGLEGKVDRHFLQRFGGAILLSLITAGGQIASNDNTDTQVIIAATRGVTSDAAAVALQKELNIPPTVKVPQGAPIRVFVTRDLDFSVLAEDVPK